MPPEMAPFQKEQASGCNHRILIFHTPDPCRLQQQSKRQPSPIESARGAPRVGPAQLGRQNKWRYALEGSRDGGRELCILEAVDSAVENGKRADDLGSADNHSAREQNGGRRRQGPAGEGREIGGDARLRLSDQGAQVLAIRLGRRHELESRKVVRNMRTVARKDAGYARAAHGAQRLVGNQALGNALLAVVCSSLLASEDQLCARARALSLALLATPDIWFRPMPKIPTTGILC